MAVCPSSWRCEVCFKEEQTEKRLPDGGNRDHQHDLEVVEIRESVMEREIAGSSVVFFQKRKIE